MSFFNSVKRLFGFGDDDFIVIISSSAADSVHTEHTTHSTAETGTAEMTYGIIKTSMPLSLLEYVCSAAARRNFKAEIMYEVMRITAHSIIIINWAAEKQIIR